MQTIIARWQDWSGNGIEHFVLKEGANETPFTITPPIRRRNLQRGQSQQIFAAYVPFLPGIYVTTDRQRYTCGEVERSYREGNPK